METTSHQNGVHYLDTPEKQLIYELTQALAYWLPDKEPLLFQHDQESEAHKAKYWEGVRLLESSRITK